MHLNTEEEKKLTKLEWFFLLSMRVISSFVKKLIKILSHQQILFGRVSCLAFNSKEIFLVFWTLSQINGLNFLFIFQIKVLWNLKRRRIRRKNSILSYLGAKRIKANHYGCSIIQNRILILIFFKTWNKNILPRWVEWDLSITQYILFTTVNTCEI